MSHASETPNRQRPLVAAIVGTVVIMAYALFAAVQILVLNPLAAVPGASLRDIYAHVAEAGESMGVLVVLASLAVGPGIAIALLVAVWSGPATSVRRVALQYLAVVALGALGYFWASFGPGMALGLVLHQRGRPLAVGHPPVRRHRSGARRYPPVRLRHIASSTLRRDSAGHAELAC